MSPKAVIPPIVVAFHSVTRGAVDPDPDVGQLGTVRN
jgi:hypothetical protein